MSIWRGAAIAVIVVVVVLASAGIAALLLIDWDAQRGRAEAFLSTAAGREVRIGHLELDPGWRISRVLLRDLTIANAEWAADRPLASIAELDLSIETWPLLRGQINLPEIILRRPELFAEVAEDGKVNWEMGQAAETAGEVAAPDERTEFPDIGRLVVEGGQLSYRDATKGLDLEGTVETAIGDTKGAVDIALKGTLEQQPVTFSFGGGPLLELREPTEPYPFQVAIDAGDTKVRAKGTTMEPVQLTQLDLQLDISGPSMDEIFPLFGIPLPKTKPYAIEGHLQREGDKWRMDSFSGNVAESDLSGWATIDYGPDVPKLEAELDSDRLDFADLGGLIGLEPEAEKQEESGLLPDTPLALDRLKVMDMDVRLKGARVIAQTLPVEALEMRIQLQGGRVHVEPLVFYVAEGRIAGTVTVDGSQSPPTGAADLAASNLDLKPFFRDSELVEQMGGRFVGRADLQGAGLSLADMLGSANGELALAMRDGRISALVVEAVGLDAVEALGLALQGDVPVGIRCGRINLKVENGLARFDRSVIDTTDSVLLVGGAIDLGKEVLDVQVEAREKDFSLIDLAAPVRAAGPLAAPEIAIGGVDPLPFFEMGEQTDLNCDKLLDGLEPAPAQ